MHVAASSTSSSCIAELRPHAYHVPDWMARATYHSTPTTPSAAAVSAPCRAVPCREGAPSSVPTFYLQARQLWPASSLQPDTWSIPCLPSDGRMVDKSTSHTWDFIFNICVMSHLTVLHERKVTDTRITLSVLGYLRQTISSTFNILMQLPSIKPQVDASLYV